MILQTVQTALLHEKMRLRNGENEIKNPTYSFTSLDGLSATLLQSYQKIFFSKRSFFLTLDECFVTPERLYFSVASSQNKNTFFFKKRRDRKTLFIMWSSHPEVFCKKAVSKFARPRPLFSKFDLAFYWNSIPSRVKKKCFPENFLNIFKTLLCRANLASYSCRKHLLEINLF